MNLVQCKDDVCRFGAAQLAEPCASCTHGRIRLNEHSPIVTKSEIGIIQQENAIQEVQKHARWIRVAGFLVHHPELLAAAVGGVLLLSGFLVGLFDGPDWLRFGLLATSYLVSGRYTGVQAWQTLRRFQFNIDVLMFAAAFGAAAIGHPEEGALLLFLFALGESGEHLALDRARRAISALSQLTPDTATIVRDGHEMQVHVEQLRVGDRIIVRPYERIAADGKVIQGASAVDQAPITGESIPVEKVAGEDVFAGTINGDGRLLVEVSRLASQSTLAKIIKLVEEAQTMRSGTQKFTDSVEKWYVPLVLIATCGLIVIPPLVAGAWAVWFYRAMGFLTAASPCALAIGTPAAVLCGIARSARLGVLIKGGAHLENLGRTRVICFDKTGTLTTGKPSVMDIVPLAGQSEDELLALAAAVERESTHPLASAIVAEAQQHGLKLPAVNEVEQVPGHGVTALVDGQRITAGHTRLMDKARHNDTQISDAMDRLLAAGWSLVALVGEAGRPIGLIALADQLRDSAPAALAQLHRLGINKSMMLTGDHAQAAQHIGKQAGMDEVHAELLPQQKLQMIQRLVKQYRHVAMVGDGVNDAPALAYASVGVAMGGAGADVAMETADVVLMGGDLNRLADAVDLSRRARRTIVQNLVIALGVIGVMAPAAGLGFASLGIAVLFHEGSTVVVVLNALRLLAYRGVRQNREK